MGMLLESQWKWATDAGFNATKRDCFYTAVELVGSTCMTGDAVEDEEATRETIREALETRNFCQ